jgi:hypothetical protein
LERSDLHPKRVATTSGSTKDGGGLAVGTILRLSVAELLHFVVDAVHQKKAWKPGLDPTPPARAGS